MHAGSGNDALCASNHRTSSSLRICCKEHGELDVDVVDCSTFLRVFGASHTIDVDELAAINRSHPRKLCFSFRTWKVGEHDFDANERKTMKLVLRVSFYLSCLFMSSLLALVACGSSPLRSRA